MSSKPEPVQNMHTHREWQDHYFPQHFTVKFSITQINTPNSTVSRAQCRQHRELQVPYASTWKPSSPKDIGYWFQTHSAHWDLRQWLCPIPGTPNTIPGLLHLSLMWFRSCSTRSLLLPMGIWKGWWHLQQAQLPHSTPTLYTGRKLISTSLIDLHTLFKLNANLESCTNSDSY